MASCENLHTRITVETKQIIFMYIANIFAIITMKEEVMNLKESKEVFGGFGGIRGRKEIEKMF